MALHTALQGAVCGAILPIGGLVMAAKKLAGELIGRNVTVAKEGNILLIRCDLSAETKASASGKSEVIGTTNGNVAVPGTDLKLGLNLYRPQ